MSILNVVLKDLRERRLWPAALALVVALVAVPMLLAKKATTAPVQPAAGATAAIPPAAGLPVVNVTATPSEAPLRGPSRDPFSQQQHAAAAAMTSTSGSTATGSSSTTGASGSTGSGSSSSSTSASTSSKSGSGSSSSSGSSGSNGTSTTPGSTTPPGSGKPGSKKPAPSGLSSTEAYDVAFAITNASGGFSTIDPLERLSELPSAQQPLLVELGVLKGGGRVLFAVRPGTVVSGPGSCTPGPIDCQVLSLGVDQIEGLSMRTSTGVAPVALFAVTSIKVHKYHSAAAATKARDASSAAGRRLLGRNPGGALSLFKYEPSAGVLVDLRNLTVGVS